MTRVYLMADFGKGPRYISAWNARRVVRVNGQRMTHPGPRTLAECEMQSFPGSVTCGIRANGVARAWWLVECESAEHGRRVIARGEEFRKIHATAIAGCDRYPEPDTCESCDCGQPDRRPEDRVSSHLEGCASYGRILDSGGQR